MTFFVRTSVNLYGGLLRLYPRQFQADFREEMLGVFLSTMKDAAGIGTLALLQLLFFEMLDYPINLAIEHLSQWRKEWSMKDTRFDIRPFRSAIMGALGLSIGYLFLMLVRWHLPLPDWWYKVHIGISITKVWERIPEVLNYSLASALFGLLLCLSVPAHKRIILRACLIMVGLGAVANLVGIISISLLERYIYEWNWPHSDAAMVFYEAVIGIIMGLFIGAGLGLSVRGRKSFWRFTLIGMLAYGFGFAIGLSFYLLGISSGWSRWITKDTAMVITTCIGAILAGGILGWFWGKERANVSPPVIEGSPAR